MSLTVERFRADRVGPPQIQDKQKPATIEKQDRKSFTDHLEKACSEVGCRIQFSGHAQTRAISRQIDLNSDQLSRLGKAVESAAEKGADKALVMLDDLALIVGVEKRTVITIVDSDGLRDNVFTAIDSAVIA